MPPRDRVLETNLGTAAPVCPVSPPAPGGKPARDPAPPPTAFPSAPAQQQPPAECPSLRASLSPSPSPPSPVTPPTPRALSRGPPSPAPSPSHPPPPRTLAPHPRGLRLREPLCASSQTLWASLPSQPSVSSTQAAGSFRMTLDVGPEDELPDWAAAKEFYQKYDPKDVIGR